MARVSNFIIYKLNYIADSILLKKWVFNFVDYIHDKIIDYLYKCVEKCDSDEWYNFILII